MFFLADRDFTISTNLISAFSSVFFASKIHLKLDPKAQGLMDWGPNKKYESKATEPSMAGSWQKGHQKGHQKNQKNQKYNRK